MTRARTRKFFPWRNNRFWLILSCVATARVALKFSYDTDDSQQFVTATKAIFRSQTNNIFWNIHISKNRHWVFLRSLVKNNTITFKIQVQLPSQVYDVTLSQTFSTVGGRHSTGVINDHTAIFLSRLFNRSATRTFTTTHISKTAMRMSS